MSDLISCETMNFSKLALTYDDFLVPAVKVTIGSTSYSSGIVKETKNGKNPQKIYKVQVDPDRFVKYE